MSCFLYRVSRPPRFQHLKATKDNHLLLIDLRSKGINGSKAELVCEQASIVLNKRLCQIIEELNSSKRSDIHHAHIMPIDIHRPRTSLLVGRRPR